MNFLLEMALSLCIIKTFKSFPLECQIFKPRDNEWDFPFSIKSLYQLRSRLALCLYVYFFNTAGSVAFLGSKLWMIIPNKLREVKHSQDFMLAVQENQNQNKSIISPWSRFTKLY